MNHIFFNIYQDDQFRIIIMITKYHRCMIIRSLDSRKRMTKKVDAKPTPAACGTMSAEASTWEKQSGQLGVPRALSGGKTQKKIKSQGYVLDFSGVYAQLFDIFSRVSEMKCFKDRHVCRIFVFHMFILPFFVSLGIPAWHVS